MQSNAFKSSFPTKTSLSPRMPFLLHSKHNNPAFRSFFVLTHNQQKISALLQRRGGRRENGRRLSFCSEYDQKGASKANTSYCCSAEKKLHTASTDCLTGENISNMHTFCWGAEGLRVWGGVGGGGAEMELESTTERMYHFRACALLAGLISHSEETLMYRKGVCSFIFRQLHNSGLFLTDCFTRSHVRQGPEKSEVF